MASTKKPSEEPTPVTPVVAPVKDTKPTEPAPPTESEKISEKAEKKFDVPAENVNVNTEGDTAADAHVEDLPVADNKVDAGDLAWVDSHPLVFSSQVADAIKTELVGSDGKKSPTLEGLIENNENEGKK